MKRLIQMVIVMAMLVSLVVVGCAAPATPTPTEVPPTPTTAGPTPTPVPSTPTPEAGPKPGGTLIVAWSAQPDGLFPDYVGTVTASYAMSVLYNGLTKVDSEGNVVGDLAESWTVSDDDLTYTFKLREGVVWHDGKALTAEDVKFTFEYPADPDYTGADFPTISRLKGAQAKHDGEADEIEGVKVIDDYTISLTTEEAYALFLETVATKYIMPAHVLEGVPVAEFAESNQNRSPVGTGPYRVVEWKADESLTFEAFDDYFGEIGYIDTYIWKVMPELPTQVTELLAGGVHAVMVVSADDFPSLQENPDLQTVKVPGVQHTFVELNHSKPFFSDKRVRQAMAYAIDKEAMLDALNAGLGTVVTSPVHPSLPEYNLGLKGYPYDLDKAKALLAEAGWTDEDGDGVVESHGVAGLTDGTPFRVKFGSLTIRRYLPQALIVQEYLKGAGIDLEIEEVDFNLFFSEYLTPQSDFDMAGSGWFNLVFHPQLDLEYNYLSEAWNTQVLRYENEELDGLIRQAPTIFDPEERRQVYWEIQEIIEEDVPKIFLTRDDTLAAFDKNLALPEFKTLNDMFSTIPLWYWKE